jgi:glycerol-3-phosphate dehydrogenase
MLRLGVEINQVKQGVPLRSPESILGSARVIEPLKNTDSDEDRETKPAFWPFAALFRAKEAAELPSLREPYESPSLTLSSASAEMDERSTSVRSEDSSRKLRFNEQVEVCFIPKRDEYSKRIRVHLWHSPEEMAAAAHRNTIEFAAEGWDPQNCMEEENMYRCLSTNELIHPVHVEQPVAGS